MRAGTHLGTDLVPTLARLDVHNLPHGGRVCARALAGSPDGGVTAAGRALPGLDPARSSALAFPSNGSWLSRLQSPPPPKGQRADPKPGSWS